MNSKLIDTAYKRLSRKQIRTLERQIATFTSFKHLELLTADNFKKLATPKASFRYFELSSNSIWYLDEEAWQSLYDVSTTLQECCDLAGKATFDEVFQAIKSTTESLLTKNLTPETLKDLLQNLSEEFVADIDSEYIFCYAIDGLFFEDEQSSITISDTRFTHYNSSNVAPLANDKHFEACEDFFKQRVCAIHKIRGTKGYTADVVVEQIERSLGALGIFLGSYYPEFITRNNLRVVSQTHHGTTNAISLSWKREDSAPSISTRSPTNIIELSDSRIIEVCNDELKLMGEIIEKSKRTDLEECLYVACYWYLAALQDESRAGSFLKLWSSMEQFFTLDSDKVTQVNSLAISTILLGFMDEMPGVGWNYEKLSSDLKRWYGDRSRIAHQGRFNRLSKLDLQNFGFIVSHTLIGLIKLTKLGYESRKEVVAKAHQFGKQLG